jgi:U3 small nucleolar RNA-associated protein 21
MLEGGAYETNFTKLITFTLTEAGKWVPLINLDEIKERNKLENGKGGEDMDFNMPFFLDFAH